MNRFFRLISNVALTLGLALPGPTQADPLTGEATTNRIRIRVFVYAKVPRRVTAGALAESNRALGQSGVETTWIECEVKQNIRRSSRCTAKPTAMDIIVRIVSKPLSPSVERNRFGIAFIPDGERFGVHATVFYARVREYSERWQASEGLLLGHLIAHEIGHLLLGANSHSISGIMKARWGRETVKQASRAALRFTPRQTKSMQEQVNRRFALSTARSSPLQVIASGTEPARE